MNAFEIVYDESMKQDKTWTGIRTKISAILNNLLGKAGCNPSQFKVSVFPDKNSDVAVIGSDGCEFRKMDSKDLAVTVFVGKAKFLAKIRPSVCKPHTLNQDIRRALGTSGKAEFQFVGDQAYGKETPELPSIKPKPQQPTIPTPEPEPIMKPTAVVALPDKTKKSTDPVNLLAAHVAIYRETGDKKDHPFNCSDAQDWINHHGFEVEHPVATGIILERLVRLGLYTMSKVKLAKTWSMTSLGVEVATGIKPLPADETPKRPRRKKGDVSTAAKPDEGEATGGAKESKTSVELQQVLAVSGVHTDKVMDLVSASDLLKEHDAARAVLMANKERLIAELRADSVGVLVDHLQSAGII